MKMDTWNFSSGTLHLGETSHIVESSGHCISRIVQTYCPQGLYHDKFLELMKYNIKTSKDNKYCAVYAENHLHCDFYQQIISKEGSESKNIGEFLFTLKRNTYKIADIGFIIEFFEHPETKETLFVFNPQHGELSIYNMQGNKVIVGENSNDFYDYSQIINEDYFFLKGWTWHQFEYFRIYKINEFLTNHHYNPPEFKTNYSPEIIDGNLIIDGFSFSPKFFYEHGWFLMSHYPKLRNDKIVISNHEFDYDTFKFFTEECVLQAESDIN